MHGIHRDSMVNMQEDYYVYAKSELKEVALQLRGRILQIDRLEFNF